MPEVIRNTSPLQYLHQIGLLSVLQSLAQRLIVPPAVISELRAGRELGFNLPAPEALDWITVRKPASAIALPLVTDLGPSETEALALALELPGSVVLLDDGLARQVAETLAIGFTGTLGVLLDANRAGLVPAVALLLHQLQALGFRLHARTRAAVLDLAG